MANLGKVRNAEIENENVDVGVFNQLCRLMDEINLEWVSQAN